MRSACFKICSFALLLLSGMIARAQETQKIFLSGTGSDHTTNWQFFCTGGSNSGKWTTIPVPSNWELQGFGKYNYGLAKDSLKGKEKGLYKYEFDVPAAWQGKTINIVFDGSMTDTEVKLNGKSAGAIHQGAFYRFKYNVTGLINCGKRNLLEVAVSKHSANASVNAAERKGDFWVFGGIFRPVFLEAFPKMHINYCAVNANANGLLNAALRLSSAKEGTVSGQVYTLNGKKVGPAFSGKINAGDTLLNIGMRIASPKLWSPEFPNLYKVVFSLSQGGKVIHTVKERFGFRTVELREHDGIYVNNVKIKFKGVNRHSFWPKTGRALNKKQSIDDVTLIKSMNMNAVRMSHYPPDDHFLDVCDSLGLFVLDELAGWHGNYDTEVGSKLVKEMILKDVNHPSIVVWDNGNEGGFNFDLDHFFDDLDIQKRPLIHPWAVFRGTNTQHYINYDYGTGTNLHGHDIAFPTEFLHGLYDGGGGAGLDDFWELMYRTPLSAGGFIWDFADEDVVRTDQNNELDSDGDHAADGVLGPYHEKEGSYYAIKEIWCPVYLEPREITRAFNGNLRLENRYLYTNLKQCTFSYKLAKFNGPWPSSQLPSPQSGVIAPPNVAPGQYGNLQINLPNGWQNYEVLYITALDPYKRELFTWSFPIKMPHDFVGRIVARPANYKITVVETDSVYKVANVNGLQLEFNRNSGVLKKVRKGGIEIPFNNGPVLAEGGEKTGFKKLNCHYEKDTVVVEAAFEPKANMAKLKWTIYPSGWIKLDVKYWPVGEEGNLLGVSFSYPEKNIKGVQYMGSGPYRVWKNRLKGTSIRVWEKHYNNTITGQPKIEYPEFKGYYANLYWMRLNTGTGPITIVCDNRDVFMRLFTPDNPKKVYNTAPAFPSGDISFMHGISPIGNKSQKPDKLGAQGFPNKYFDYYKDTNMALSLTLYFDFSGR